MDDVEAARGELEAKGVEFAADTMDSGVCHMAFFKDPDGNALMLHHRYAPQERAGSPARPRLSGAARQSGRLGERHLDVGEDRALRARCDDRLAQPLHVHVGATSVLALAALERDQREDPVGAHVLAVAERDHAWVALGRHRPYVLPAASR